MLLTMSAVWSCSSRTSSNGLSTMAFQSSSFSRWYRLFLISLSMLYSMIFYYFSSYSLILPLIRFYTSQSLMISEKENLLCSVCPLKVSCSSPDSLWMSTASEEMQASSCFSR